VRTDMQEWTDIRRKVLTERASKRSVCDEYRIGWRILEKILTNTEPPGYRTAAPRPKTKLGPYLGVISKILASDADAPPKQHHTAKRIFERLRDEHGYEGGITQVKEAVALHRRHNKEVFVPLSHRPGEAQFDFGQATVDENTGEKLTPQLVSTLAEPFQRGTERIRTDHAGVGLGLAIVRSITQAHDGTLTLTPRAAGGLRVTVQLPAAPPHTGT